MTSDWLGGGLIVGLAAVLWLIYLLPTWFRRNEYLATERNVVRLQQTLRILAETAEAPDEVRAEASARSVVEQQRLLKKVTVDNTPPAILAAAKIRRARAVTSGVLVLALAVVVLGALQIAVNGAWIVLALGVVASTLCLTRLARLAKLGRAIRLPAPGTSLRSAVDRTDRMPGDTFSGDELGATALDAEDDLYDDDDVFDEDEPAEPAALAPGWTPVPLPKPLYVGQRRLVAAAGASVYAEQTAQQAEEALRAAARQAEVALRAASIEADQSADATQAVMAGQSADAAQWATAAQSAAAGQSAGLAQASAADRVATGEAAQGVQPSRFSSMGIVDDADTGSFDVDRVLARRRAG